MFNFEIYIVIKHYLRFYRDINKIFQYNNISQPQ